MVCSEHGAWDIRRNLVFCDELLADYFAIPANDISTGAPSERFLEAVHPDDLDAVTERMRHAMATHGPMRSVQRVRTRSLGERRLLTVARAHVDRAGAPTLMQGCTFDVTGKSFDLAKTYVELARKLLPDAAPKVLDYLFDALLLELGEAGRAARPEFEI